MSIKRRWFAFTLKQIDAVYVKPYTTHDYERVMEWSHADSVTDPFCAWTRSGAERKAKELLGGITWTRESS